MTTQRFLLNPSRTSKQGVRINVGKFDDEYAEIVTSIEIHPDDMAALGVSPADIEPKVTEHIPEIVALVEKLVELDFAYPADGDVYFAVEKFSAYGHLGRRTGHRRPLHSRRRAGCVRRVVAGRRAPQPARRADTRRWRRALRAVGRERALEGRSVQPEDTTLPLNLLCSEGRPGAGESAQIEDASAPP